jgi:hypothetical protein
VDAGPRYRLGGHLERFSSESLLRTWIAGWTPVRVKKTRQIKNPELRFDSIETAKALPDAAPGSMCWDFPWHRLDLADFGFPDDGIQRPVTEP